jgi:hypothetical protein
MRSLALACVCVVALALSGTTTASPRAKPVPLTLGDSIDVLKTNVYCQTLIGQAALKGKKLVACYKVRGGKAVVGSYNPALTAEGELAVGKATKTGATIVYRRRPARAGAKPRVVQAKVGDTFTLQGTDIGCAVNRTTTGTPYISCFNFNSKGGKVGSYSFSISDSAVAITQFTAPNKTKLVKTWKQPA